MRKQSLVRALALVVPMSVAGLVSAGPASAAPAVGGVTCSKLVGSPTKLTGTLSGCTASATGGSGKLSHFVPTGAKIAWKNGTSTTYSTTPKVTEGDHDAKPCPSTSHEYELKGKVTASTNHAVTVGSAVSFEVCVTTSSIVNEPGSTIKI